MKPQNQTVFGGEKGNCSNAAIATITGLPLNDFPSGEGERDGYYPALIKYLDGHGWLYFEAKLEFYFVWCGLQRVPIILSVPSQKYEGKQHAVVACLEGTVWKMLHDPNPNNDPYDLGKTEIKDYSLVLRKEGLPELEAGVEELRKKGADEVSPQTKRELQKSPERCPECKTTNIWGGDVSRWARCKECNHVWDRLGTDDPGPEDD